MNFELRKYNIDKVKKALEDVKGKDVAVNNMDLFGVTSIDISENEAYEDGPILEEGYEGIKTDFISLKFNFENGTAIQNFCPDREHCEIIFETDDLWIIRIEDLKEYIDRKKFDLDFQLKEYEKYMSK